MRPILPSDYPLEKFVSDSKAIHQIIYENDERDYMVLITDYFLHQYPDSEEASWKRRIVCGSNNFLMSNEGSFEAQGYIVPGRKQGSIKLWAWGALYYFWMTMSSENPEQDPMTFSPSLNDVLTECSRQKKEWEQFHPSSD